MMITVNRVKDFIVGSVQGKPFSVVYNDEKFAKMQEFEKKMSTIDTMEEAKAIIADFNVIIQESSVYKDTVEHKTPYLHVNPLTNQYYLQFNGVLSKHALPGAFVQRIVKAVDTNNALDPIVKTIVRFLRNPHFTSGKFLRFANYLNLTHVDTELEQKLMDSGAKPEWARWQATVFQTTMTNEGLLNTYKVSTEITTKFKDMGEGEATKVVDRREYEFDEFTGLKKYIDPEFVEDRIFQPVVMGTGGDAFYCGELNDKNPYLGHIIRVGREHWLPSWDMVDTNDICSGVKGLHVGNLDYIRGFQRPGSVTHNVFVDPMCIGAITDDGSGAIRVLRYFVHSSFAGVNRGYYNSSKYAALTDGIYATMVEEAVAKINAESDAAVRAAAEKIEQINLTKTF